jgi:hypothetical protein
VIVVTSNRTGAGRSGRPTSPASLQNLPEGRGANLSAGDLNPQKARMLLSLAIASVMKPAAIALAHRFGSMTLRRLFAFAFAFPALLQAQEDASGNPAIRAALEKIRADNAWTVEQQISICEIPAPPFKEERRAAEMKRRFEALGLRNVRIDSIGNVIAERPGAGGGPVVVIAAHLDTVFPEETDVRVQRQGTLLKGPGIGDDCRGLAVLLAIAKAMGSASVRTQGTIFFVANVGEEGPGNLRGVKYLFAKPPAAKIDYFISIDGTRARPNEQGRREQPLQGVVQGPGRPQLRRVRHAQSHPRARSRDLEDLPRSRCHGHRRPRSTSASSRAGRR